LRSVLGIPKDTAKFKIDQDKLEDFDVFIQSTSHNRVLLPDTDFLYETGETTSDVKTADGTDGKATGSTGGKGKRKKEEV